MSVAIACSLLAAGASAQPVAVRVVSLKQILIRPQTSAPAQVVSLGDSRISSELSAVIEAIPVEVGETVEKGGVLARLDCSDYDLHAAELGARLADIDARTHFARQQLGRAESLLKQRTVSKELVEQREAELNSLQATRVAAQAALNRISRNREKCTVRAPFRGAIVERLSAIGEYATPGKQLLRMVDLDRIEVTAEVINSDAESLNKANSIFFEHAGLRKPVRLRVIAPIVNPRGRTREARLLFTAERALPGTGGRLLWRTGAALPADFLQTRDDRMGVFLAVKSRATFHPLPWAREGRPAPINLPGDVLIISDGRLGLRHNDLIRIVE